MQALLVEDDYVSSAALFTARKYALAGHFQRYSGETCIHHPRELAVLLSQFPHNREMLAAAWLSRSMQDEYTNYDEVSLLFGPKVAELTLALKNFNLPDCGGLSSLAKVNISGIREASCVQQTIALADVFVLAHTIETFTPALLTGFADWLTQHLGAFSSANPALVRKVESWLMTVAEQTCALDRAS